jgi:fatty acid desaturase
MNRVALGAAAAGALLWLGVATFCALGHGPAAWLAGPLVLLPLGMLVYALLHELLHCRGAMKSVPYHLAALMGASALGLSWKIYQGHHANHHRYSNAANDFSTTQRPDGSVMPGLEYTIRRALIPFAMQCVPFLSYWGMRRENRTSLALLDESLRVAARLGVAMVIGPLALARLLEWQAVFAVFIMYVNYLQHWRVAPGHAESWNDPIFNRAFVNFGIHDEHHGFPGRRAAAFDVRAAGPRRPLCGFHIFNPILFAGFLASPQLLGRLARLAFGEQNVHPLEGLVHP